MSEDLDKGNGVGDVREEGIDTCIGAKLVPKVPMGILRLSPLLGMYMSG